MSAPQAKPPVTPERVMQHTFGYAPPLILEAAVRHRVFDTLDKGPLTVDEVSAATGASVRGLRFLMNALIGLGFLTRDAQGRYALTPDSAAFLVSSKPGFIGGFYKHASTQLMPKWLQLTEIVRTGRPAISVNREEEGASFFEQFVEDIFPFSYPAAQALADLLSIGKATQPVRVLDLAAGSGVWGIALAQKSPQVQVTAVDWPGVLNVTRRMAARFGLQSRFQFVAGDLQSADFGSGHQVATLGHILHSEGEPRSRALLKKTFAALAPGGTAAVSEWLVNDERTGPLDGLIFAVNMLVNTELGDTFSFNEIRGWLQDAGFGDVRTADTPGKSPLILATKPGR
jgi:SAM-dependent methyltransferase